MDITDKLSKKLSKTIDNINKHKAINEDNLKIILDEIKISLLEADVNLQVVKLFLFQISQKAKGQFVDEGKTTSQKIIKIVYEELTELLGGANKPLAFKGNPAKMMMVGLQGSGKTTSVGKIVELIVNKRKEYSKPLLVACDIYRPAAIDQLEIIAKQVEADIYLNRQEKDVAKIANFALKQAEKNNNDLIIFDTAGRLHIDKNLMKELVNLKTTIKPEEILLSIDSMSGQDIINVAKQFHETLKLTGSILTKFDSDTRGGAALSIVKLLNLPIKMVGVGEKLKDVEVFHPNRVASRILGMGDIESLVEKAKTEVDEDVNQRIYRKIMANRYDLEDLLLSMEELAKMGNMSGIMKLMPGINNMVQKTEGIDEKLLVYKVLISSMTKKERKNPRLLNHPKRKNRILKGSGRTSQEFNQLQRQFEKSQKGMQQMVKMIKSGKVPNMKNFAKGSSGGNNPFGGGNPFGM